MYWKHLWSIMIYIFVPSFSVTDCDQNYMQMINLKKLPEFGYKSSYQKKILAKIFLPKKIPKSKILNPKKSFDHPCHLKSEVTPPPGTQATKSSNIY